MTRHTLALSLLLALTITACGDNNEDHESNHGQEDHDSEAEACEHTKEGPSTSVTAAQDASAPPNATAEHRRVDLTLVDYMDQKGGYARYEADESGTFYFFLDRDVTFILLDDQGAVITQSGMGADVDACEEVVIQYVANLTSGASYTMLFGPTDETEVRLVVEHEEEVGATE